MSMRQLFAEIRYAVRGFLRNPGFTATALLVLTIGIGGQYGGFQRRLFRPLKPLSYRNPSKLVVALGDGGGPVSPADTSTIDPRQPHSNGWKRRKPGAAPSRAASAPRLFPASRSPPACFRCWAFRRNMAVSSAPGTPARRPSASRDWASPLGGAVRRVPGYHRTHRPHQRSAVHNYRRHAAGFSIRSVLADPGANVDAPEPLGPHPGPGWHVAPGLRPPKGERSSMEQARAQLAGIADRLSAQYPQTNRGFQIRVTPLLETIADRSGPRFCCFLPRFFSSC